MQKFKIGDRVLWELSEKSLEETGLNKIKNLRGKVIGTGTDGITVEFNREIPNGHNGGEIFIKTNNEQEAYSSQNKTAWFFDYESSNGTTLTSELLLIKEK